MRNVTMSGLGRASVIVEAGEHSGTRIQARVAVEHGRPVILTDFVANETKWGQALKDRPGVYVAGGTAEVLDIVERVLHEDDGDALEILAPWTGTSGRPLTSTGLTRSPQIEQFSSARPAVICETSSGSRL